ncbi:MAG TPA: helix-turn-helix domain-containing protein [Mucilaginibacter sp.]|jgi:hypothetical protein
MNRSFDGIWISANLWLSKDLNLNQKIVLLEIKSLDNDFGCTATNKKIGEVIDIKPNTVSLIIKFLEEKGFIGLSYKDYNSFDGRVITIDYDKCSLFFTPPKKSKGVTEKSKAPPKKSIHSNTISNIISNNNISDELKNSSSPYGLLVDFWLKEFHIGWTFTGQTGKSVKSLIGKIKKILSDAGRDFSDAEIFSFFKAMCQNLPDWYKEKDLPVLDSKFNEIITEIKNNKNGKSTTKGQSIFRTQR